ncbi:MAG: DUF3078 domain-containing protein [Bacteroidota bacterium]|nr:DUF3078 domain-containing protein [Bacteroidota bacterium]MDP4274804.1 DUF3078 domain-containing protein [Bacteroidota bacterium]
MNKTIYVFSLLTVIPSYCFAQISPDRLMKDEMNHRKWNKSIITVPQPNQKKSKEWKLGGNLNLSGAQTSFSNWSAGGENSVSGNSYLSLFANHKTDTSMWENTLALSYGMANQGSGKLIKNDDKLNFVSNFGIKASKNWYYSGSMNLNSQMFNGYNYPNDSVVVSRLFAPAYLITSLGMDFKPQKVKNMELLLAPVTGKVTFVLDQRLADLGYFGVKKATYDDSKSLIDHGQEMKYEFGGYVKLNWNGEVMKNINMDSKLGLFTNYMHNPENIDVNWDVTLSTQINKYISANVRTSLVYDDDTKTQKKNDEGKNYMAGPQIQFKEIFGIGFAYKFMM